MPDFVDQNFEEGPQTRFWSKVFVRDLDECWPWLRSSVEKCGTTYPKASYIKGWKANGAAQYSQMSARRLAAILAGLIPPDVRLEIPSNICSDPTCCNPLHLARHFARNPAIDPIDQHMDNWGCPEIPCEADQQTGVSDPDYFRAVLEPLKEGRSVLLSMRTEQTRRTKVVTGLKPIPVVVMPGVCIGLPETSVLISVVNHGSCMIDVNFRSNLARLALAGMPMAYARFLVDAIHRVLGE